ncbi:MAG: TM0996/MTH895 family glutaredoxin-like protein [Methanobacterium sp.]|jgi:small redox-active disulfide protein 2|uniref:thioredoxin family protein n=1 Tax=Methanobacterium sp. TaxID=2164 RepID=UPI00258315CE|nr:thioredoxin family protein [Methanobacterium sp.]MCC7559575.1 TM0996/MTH895 family glutaredoxin-like protein [Methanobacterium sp.]HOI39919.1 thioredoxin family protein [Methanobacterium sp.]
MKIEVYGTGCANCKALENNARKAAEESGVQAEIVKIQEMDQIFEAGITGTPGLGIDGEIKSMGRIPSVDEIKKWIESKK